MRERKKRNQSNLGTETHLREREKEHIEITRGGYGEERCATNRDCILERALGIYKIPLDDRIGRLELTEFGVVRLSKQILRDRRQCLWVRRPMKEKQKKLGGKGESCLQFSSLARARGRF
jgi:hypothetical protein